MIGNQRQLVTDNRQLAIKWVDAPIVWQKITSLSISQPGCDTYCIRCGAMP